MLPWLVVVGSSFVTLSNLWMPTRRRWKEGLFDPVAVAARRSSRALACWDQLVGCLLVQSWLVFGFRWHYISVLGIHGEEEVGTSGAQEVPTVIDISSTEDEAEIPKIRRFRR